MTSTESTIVIDNGSYSCKFGFAGENKPRIIVESILGVEDKPNVTGISHKTHFGTDVYKDIMLKMIKPIRDGIVNDYESLEKLYSHVFDERMNIKVNEHSVLISDPPLNSKKDREKICELLMEKFQAREFCLQNQGQLILETTKTNTGLVVDCGHDVCHIIPIYEGLAIKNGIDKFDLAGNHLTNYLLELLQTSDAMLPSGTSKRDVQQIKEDTCAVGIDYLDQTSNSDMSTYTQWASSDKKIYRLKFDQCECPEILFKPQIIGHKYGLHKVIFDTILKCDNEIQTGMFNNIVLGGGTMNLKNIDKRIENELSSLTNYQIKPIIKKQSQAEMLCWLGASTIASSEFIKKLSINQQDYFENGSRIVHERFF